MWKNYEYCPSVEGRDVNQVIFMYKDYKIGNFIMLYINLFIQGKVINLFFKCKNEIHLN